jgi:hypothetical protein
VFVLLAILGTARHLIRPRSVSIYSLFVSFTSCLCDLSTGAWATCRFSHGTDRCRDKNWCRFVVIYRIDDVFYLLTRRVILLHSTPCDATSVGRYQFCHPTACSSLQRSLSLDNEQLCVQTILPPLQTWHL